MNYIRGAIHRPVTVSMFVVAVILFGIVSLDRLALNLLPDISYPSLTVDTAYADAAPEEIESLITQPVEEAVGVVSGLTRISSSSWPGQSEVVLEFNWKTDMDWRAGRVNSTSSNCPATPGNRGFSGLIRPDPIMRVRLQGLRHPASRRFAERTKQNSRPWTASPRQGASRKKFRSTSTRKSWPS